ncbi:hypothetical protein DL768_006552 [Monosporascus sp. mg162]|nr:hypothetical protein DL768_006552 [Monosporascus sp. mg162]
MSSPGSYREWIKSLIDSGYPNLKFLDDKIMQNPERQDTTCTILSFSHDGDLQGACSASETDFNKATVGKSRRLFILEGLSKEFIEKLGSALDIEPEFFAAHLRATTWEHHDDRSDAVTLPSIRKQTKSWTVQYLECIRLNRKYRLGRTRLIPCKHEFRRLFIRSPHRDQTAYYSVGLVNRFVSFWEKTSSEGNFDAVALVDIPLPANLTFEYDDVRPLEVATTTWLPYGGGFVDFANLDMRRAFARHCPKNSELRNGSVKDSLLWRLRHPELFGYSGDQISPVQLILQRIALSNWTLTIAFLRRDFNSIDLHDLTNEGIPTVQVKETLANLTAYRGLLNRCWLLLRKNLGELNIPAEDNGSGALTAANVNISTELLRLDWEFVWCELRDWIKETDRLVELRLSNLHILDSKRSRDDSERASRDSKRSEQISYSSAQINKLGQILLLIYTPAAFAYGVLSMGGDFLPGNKNFWVFFAIAIPLGALTNILFIIWMRSTQAKRVGTINV